MEVTDAYKLEVYSDYHKDVFGFRPNCITDAQRIAAYDAASAYLTRLKSTRSGRAKLRASGWIIKD